MSSEKKELYEYLFFGVCMKFLPTTSWTFIDYECGIQDGFEKMDAGKRQRDPEQWLAGCKAFKILKEHKAIKKVKIEGPGGNRYAWELRFWK